MAKTSPGDIKAILRQFNIDGSDDSEKHIDLMQTSNPSPVSTLVAFRFNKRHYRLLFDETAEDDIERLQEQVLTSTDSSKGTFIKNPEESFLTFGVPFKGKTVYLYLAQADKKRLDNLLAELYPETSRSTWQKHIKAGRVKVNEEVVTSPKFEALASDKLTLDLPNDPDHSEKDLPIIYLDDNVIVINKPEGVLTHAKGALSDEFTVADFFRRYTKVGLDTNRPGIVHRLDRDTSGVLIGVRTEVAAKLLSRQFADRKTKKTYIAILSGHLKQKEATIELPIDRNPSAPSTFRVAATGRMAVTHYKVLAENKNESLIELRPVTGRTHQLRVHMAYLGAPIKGDRLYGRASDRLYLHAQKLEITIPTSNRCTFEAPLPESFMKDFEVTDNEHHS